MAGTEVVGVSVFLTTYGIVRDTFATTALITFCHYNTEKKVQCKKAKACATKGVRFKTRALQKACAAKGVRCKKRALQKACASKGVRFSKQTGSLRSPLITFS